MRRFINLNYEMNNEIPTFNYSELQLHINFSISNEHIVSKNLGKSEPYAGEMTQWVKNSLVK